MKKNFKRFEKEVIRKPAHKINKLIASAPGIIQVLATAGTALLTDGALFPTLVASTIGAGADHSAQHHHSKHKKLQHEQKINEEEQHQLAILNAKKAEAYQQIDNDKIELASDEATLEMHRQNQQAIINSERVLALQPVNAALLTNTLEAQRLSIHRTSFFQQLNIIDAQKQKVNSLLNLCEAKEIDAKWRDEIRDILSQLNDDVLRILNNSLLDVCKAIDNKITFSQLLILEAKHRLFFSKINSVLSARHTETGPLLADRSGFAEEKYYGTIQTQILKIGATNNIVLMCRQGGGVTFWLYNPDRQKWEDNGLPALGRWSDAGGAGLPKYYKTMQLQTLTVNGEQCLFLFGRNGLGILLFQYTPSRYEWKECPSYTAGWGDNSGCGQPEYYETLQTQVLKIKEEECLFFLGRDGGSIHLYQYTPSTSRWQYSAGLCTTMGKAWSDENGCNKPEYYQTLQSQVLTVSSEQCLFLLGRDSDGIHLYQYRPSQQQWQYCAGILGWGDSNGCGKAPYYKTLQTHVLSFDGESQLYLLGRNSSTILLYCYNPTAKKWTACAGIPHEWDDLSGHAAPEYYETLQSQVIKLEGQDYLSLIGRDHSGLHFYCYDPHNNQWRILNDITSEWADASLNKPEYYRTLQSQVVITAENKSALVVMGRTKDGMRSYQVMPKVKAESIESDSAKLRAMR